TPTLSPHAGRGSAVHCPRPAPARRGRGPSRQRWEGEGQMMFPALSGLRVIAVEQYGAGPNGSMERADLGAEVIKIENPAEGGDMARRVGPYFAGPDDSQFFHSFNRNKKSLTLDLKQPAARAILHRLVARADGVLDNLRG